MAIRHDFQCPDGHVFEASVQWDTDFLPCRQSDCRKKADRVFLPRSRDASAFRNPVVVFKDKNTGKFIFPGRSDKPTPEGCERIELRNAPEVRNFERKFNEESLRKREIRDIRDELTWGPPRQIMRQELFTKMQSFSNYGRDFARFAIEQSNRQKKPKYDPQFRVEVMD